MRPIIATCLLVLCLAPTVPAQAPAIARTPLLLDTDIGSDIDDAFALALIFASPELH